MTKNAQKIFNSIIIYEKKWKSLPTINFLAESTNKSKNVIYEYMTELSNAGMINLYDDKYEILSGISTAKLKKEKLGSTGNFFPETKILEMPEIDENKEFFANKILEKNNISYLKEIKDKKKHIKQSIFKDKFFYFKIILSIVAISFVYMGIEYNYIGFLESNNWKNALIKAIGFIFVGIILFEYTIYYFLQKKKVWILLFLIFLIVLAANFFNIFKGQFNKYQDLIYNTENIEKSNKIKLLASCENQIIKHEKEIQLQFEFIDKYKNDESKYWQIWGARNKYLPQLEKDLKIVIDKKNLLLESNVNTQEKKSVYDFISNIFKKGKTFSNILQLIYLMFPGFIVELVINISLALLFFGGKRK